MKRTATIRIRRKHDTVAEEISKNFADAWNTAEYQGEFFDFESPTALFRVFTPKRWEVLETLQARGPMGVRELARALDRDVRRVHDDVQAFLEIALIEKNEHGKLIVPYAVIHADFVLRKSEAA